MKASPDREIIQFLNRSRIILNLDDKHLGELLKVNTCDVRHVLTGQRKVTVHNLLHALNHFHVSLEAILENRVDYKTLEAQFKQKGSSDQDGLNEFYTENGHNKKRSVINILNYIEANESIEDKFLILRDFQMKLSDFDNPDEIINNRFIVELLDRLFKRGYSLKEIMAMGEFSYECNKDGVLAESLGRLSSSRELLEYFFDVAVKKYDTNYKYCITKLTDEYCEVDLYQNTDVLDAMKTEKLGSPLVSLMKSGVIKTLPKFIGMDDFDVKIGKSIHAGDDHCSYVIHYKNDKKLVH